MKQISKTWQKKPNIAVVEQWHSNHKTYPLIHWLRGRGPTGTVLLHFIRHIPSLWTLDQLPCHFSWAHLASTSHFPSASFFFCCGQITLFLQDVMRSCLTERVLRVALLLFQVLHAVYHHVFYSLVSTFNAKYMLHTPVMCRTTDYGCLLSSKRRGSSNSRVWWRLDHVLATKCSGPGKIKWW